MQDQDGTVLIVDDDEALTQVYAAWLDSRYPVETATSGQDALEALDEDVSVVLLDRRMPDLPGEAVLEAVRARAYGCRVAMVTGVRPDSDIVNMGFDDYLVKPVTGDDLIGLVERLLERHTYDDAIQEYYALAAKRATLETEAERAAREDKQAKQKRLRDTVQTVENRLDALQSEMSQVVDSFGFDDFRVAFRNLTHIEDD